MMLLFLSGTPVYISLPHFLYGTPSLTEDVLGLSPSIEHHFTYLDVEPVSHKQTWRTSASCNVMYSFSRHFCSKGFEPATYRSVVTCPSTELVNTV